MSLTILCPGGVGSQTGAAVAERYPTAIIESCGKIPDVLLMLETHPGPFVVPIWNSHEGEVEKAMYVWNSIQDAKIKLTDAWPKAIDFWFVRRADARTAFGKIGSVVVAKTQCSRFLKKQNALLEKCDLTTIAFDEYRKGAAWDGVLVAPGQGENEPSFEVVLRKTANPNNFTSFVRLVPSQAFKPKPSNAKSWLTGVKMPAFSASLGESQREFFERLLEPVRSLADLPKLIFVFNRDAKVGLLFEGVQLQTADLLDAGQVEAGDISVYENAGALAKQYTEELSGLFAQNFPAMTRDDFLLHCGVNTFLFACPPLGIYTHGYKREAVEPVVRFYISKLFQLWNDEILKCDPQQTKFFKRHKRSWLEKASGFMQFKEIKATGS